LGHVVHTGDSVYLEDEAARRASAGLGPAMRVMRRLADRDPVEAGAHALARRGAHGPRGRDGPSRATTNAASRGLAPFPYAIAETLAGAAT